MLFNLVYEIEVENLQYFTNEDGGGDWEDVGAWVGEHGGVFATQEELAKALVAVAPLIHKGEIKNLKVYMAD